MIFEGQSVVQIIKKRKTSRRIRLSHQAGTALLRASRVNLDGSGIHLHSTVTPKTDVLEAITTPKSKNIVSLATAGNYLLIGVDCAIVADDNHAFNVADLIHAALANPTPKSKHIVLPAAAEQYISLSPTITQGGTWTGAPAGTGFDPEHVELAAVGNMSDFSLEVGEMDLLSDATVNQLDVLGDEQSGASNSDLRTTQMSILTSEDDKHKPLSRKGSNLLDKASFAETGRLFLVPHITDKDLVKLRNGEVLADKVLSSIGFKYKFKEDFYGPLEWGTGTVKVTAKDFQSAQGRVFFGDRPLDNPGYSQIKLKGEVGVGVASMDKLDIYKVEQRLKYLGFPAMGAPDTNGNPERAVNRNTLQDFVVNGVWGPREARAAYLFNKVINFGAGNSQLITPPDRPANSKMPADKRKEYFDALEAAVITSPTAAIAKNGNTFVKYLNAINAPHWMNIYDNLRTQTNYARITVGMDTTESLEMYGTSWLRDWLRAYNSADSNLRTGQLRFNGVTDANHGKTPFAHGTHDLGMALDLGFVEAGYLRQDASQRTDEAATTALSTVSLTHASSAANSWSKQNALDLLTARSATGVNLVKDVEFNNQVAALKNFLALYSLTQKDRAVPAVVNGASATQVKDTGDWDSISLINERAGTNDLRSALFGDGTQANGLIRQVHVGAMKKVNGVLTTIANQNPLYDMRTVLTRLGVTVSPVEAHHHHYHIYLRPPKALAFANNLQTTPVKKLDASLSANQEESAMLFDIAQAPLPPQLPVQSSIFAAQANKPPLPSLSTFDRIYEACSIVETQVEPVKDFIGPGGSLRLHWDKYPKQSIGNGDLSKAKVTVLEAPKYGLLKFLGKIDPDFGAVYSYEPTLGTPNGTQDSVVFLVEIGGKRLKVTQRLVMAFNLHDESKDCSGTSGYQKRISMLDVIDSSQSITAWQKSADLSAFLAAASGITYTFSSLPSSAIGTTTGTGLAAQIQLDNDAAGHGWYAPSTGSGRTDWSLNNADYLPTSDPTVWKAKAGSAAAGRMDMLSVLLHEYGHALGLAHSGDGRDFMSATLAPGVRKLPSEVELELMANLVAQLKASADTASSPQSALLTAPRRGALEGARRGALELAQTTLAPTHIDYLSATLPTLTNGNFAAG